MCQKVRFDTLLDVMDFSRPSLLSILEVHNVDVGLKDGEDVGMMQKRCFAALAYECFVEWTDDKGQITVRELKM